MRDRSKRRTTFTGALLFTLAASVASCGAPQEEGPTDPATAGGQAASVPPGRAPLPSGRPSWATPDRLQRMAGPTGRVDLQIYLGLRDRDAALAELQAVSDPRSPRYGRFLSTEEFRARYAPR